MGDLVLLHFVQDKFTTLKEEKWDIGFLGLYLLGTQVADVQKLETFF